MQSQPLKRVVSSALAASAVIAAVTLAPTAATASPTPALQQPASSPSDALEKYRELAGQAEKINQDYLKAKEDLAKKQDLLRTANRQLENAGQAIRQAKADEERFRGQVDQIAGASFTSGAQLNKVSALLTGGSAQDFLERSSALSVLATKKNEALSRLTGAVEAAKAAEQQAAEAQRTAQQAKDAAAKLKADIGARKDRLEEQVDQLAEQAGLLSGSDLAAQQDVGDAVGEIDAPGPAAEAAINSALSQRGTPYVWGGSEPGGFDCSGLMQWAYEQAGISLPRTSSSQASYGTPVPRDQLMPGDLVYFYSPVSHIGMYIGNGQMVHAPTSGDVVKVSSLSEQSSYSGATRVT